MDSGNMVAVAWATGVWVVLSPRCDVTGFGDPDTNSVGVFLSVCLSVCVPESSSPHSG